MPSEGSAGNASASTPFVNRAFLGSGPLSFYPHGKMPEKPDFRREEVYWGAVLQAPGNGQLAGPMTSAVGQFWTTMKIQPSLGSRVGSQALV